MLSLTEKGKAKFKIADLFNIKNGKKTFHAKNVKENMDGYNYVVRKTTDNGIRCKIKEDEKFLNDGHVISFAQDTFKAYYQEKPFFNGNKIKILAAKNKLSKESLLFLVIAINKAVNHLSWGKSCNDKILGNIEILLPVTEEGTPDYEYMEEFIKYCKEKIIQMEKEEQERDYNIYKEIFSAEEFTDEDQETLDMLNVVDKAEFIIGDLFEVKNNLSLKKDDLNFGAKEKYPYFTRTEKNNGFLGNVSFYDEKHLIKGDSLAVGMLGMKFFYMEKDFYAGPFTKTLYPKFKGFNKNIALYFCSQLNKYKTFFQSVLVKDFEKTINSTYISLPVTPEGNPDYEFMEQYIQAASRKIIFQMFKKQEEEETKQCQCLN